MAEITNGYQPTTPAEEEQDISAIKENLESYNQKSVEETLNELQPDTEDQIQDEVGEDTGEQEAEESSESVGASDQDADDELEEAPLSIEEINSRNAKDFEKLKTLPYIDLFGEYQKAKQALANLKSAKEMMDQVGNIADDKYSAMVGQMDISERQEMGTSIQDFYDHYDENVAEGTRIIDLMARMLMLYDKDMLGSSAFISKSAIEAAERRIPMIAEGVNHDAVVARLNVTKDAYANRTDYSMLIHKLRYPNNVLNLFKEFVKIGPEKAMKEVDKVFMPVFNDQYMKRFRQSFTELFETVDSASYTEDQKSRIEVSVFFITYWLASVYEREYTSGKCAYVKNLVMNVYDCDKSSNIYDLEGGKVYVANVCFTIFSIINTIVSGKFPAKQLNDKINGIIDGLLEVLNKNFEELKLDYPGRTIEMSTSLDAITDGMTYEELPQLDVPAEETVEEEEEPEEDDSSEEDEEIEEDDSDEAEDDISDEEEEDVEEESSEDEPEEESEDIVEDDDTSNDSPVTDGDTAPKTRAF